MGSPKLKLRQSGSFKPQGPRDLYRDRSPRPRLMTVGDRSRTERSPTHSLDITRTPVKRSYCKHWGIIQISIAAGLWLVLISSVKLIVSLI
jgi:hypothetical protein